MPETNQLIQKQPPSQMDLIRHDFFKMKSKFETALPSNIDVDFFFSVVMNAINRKPYLLTLNRQSLFTACIDAAQDGLLPDDREASLIKYGNNVKYQAMIYGIIKKVRNSGELVNIYADVVYEKDEFDYWTDEDGQHIKHRPNLLADDRGKIVLTFAFAKTKTDPNFPWIEIIKEDEMQKIKDKSTAKNSGPWAGDFINEMRKKSTLRRLSKRLPMSTDTRKLIEQVDEFYDFKNETQKNEKGSRLSEILNDKKPEIEINDENSKE